MLSESRKQKYRDNLGATVKEAREKAGMTQKALADMVDVEYYTMISQIECGHMAIPPALWGRLADALGLDRQQWILRCLREYQPEIYKTLFLRRSLNEVATVLQGFHKGQLDDFIKSASDS